MPVILNLETATTNCSVSIARNGRVIALKEHDTPNYSHSEQLHVFIEEVVEDARLAFSDLDAIAVSKGPGSYTGLRIGVSAAKGLCFSLDIPLISVSTLHSMAYQIVAEEFDFIIPLLDARRMEVYAAVFDRQYRQVRETRAEIIEEGSFEVYSEQGKVALIGSGAEKCKEVLKANSISYNSSIVPSAKEMSPISYTKFEAGDFESVAYFEPYYLKDFILQKKNS
ncbi:tRNA (adenosine(37)-N6)-threonylcarbamoyltransferase complex dimerization subunit type 1 TsaB [Pareuzebyella sediminis]|uniref:tRNA (adenosine(37)-N6)-threonylcarbamoyltransferase complex dimerization subunit type 1 TsaB n=1 Tax=Pareuzebyella sediminis TaxID=2607998 RepID=UPI0011EFF185|nr:tRNA (adenosine(37)-N6)-threonylcarbamoyltransferase complex dimerization subunit type 1 TsaB [Pareuzebyella sediminis]